jgi:hypothetical protein
VKIALILLALFFFVVAGICLIGSIVVFVMSRRRSAPPAMPVTPSPQPIPHTPSAIDTAATVMVPLPEQQGGTIVWLTGPLAGRRMPLTEEGSYIGREPATAQLVIESQSVSKRHAWVGIRNGRATVSDSGSTNGTFLERAPKQRISEAELSFGDVVIIADDVARFRYES